jgi:hypothetical protein
MIPSDAVHPRFSILTPHSHDLEDTFVVVVGSPPSESKRFTLHTSVFVAQSGYLAAARKPEWTAQNPGQPVDLKDEDPELFQAYMNCVYFGDETIEHWVDDYLSSLPEMLVDDKQQARDALFTKLIGLYLLCQRLIDFKAANMVIDEVIRLTNAGKIIPMRGPIVLAYSSTIKDHPLHALIRDYWIYESSNTERRVLRADDFPAECLQDITLALLGKFDEFPLRQFNLNLSVGTLCLRDKCRYHSHDEKHRRCVVKEEHTGKWTTEGESKRCVILTDEWRCR